MIHTYSLIHDDLPAMDNDDLRRGRETCHKKFGEATAILAGDALQVISFQAIADDERVPADVRLQLSSKLGKAACRMVAGQQFDLDAEGKAVSLEELEKIHRNKTGALICYSAEAGALIADAGTDDFAAVSDYGAKLGLLFQITDDVLDVVQTTESLGKTAGKDQSASKATYPSIYGIEGAKDAAKRAHADAVDALAPFGERSKRLRDIADFIIGRRS
jgi:geranylgeranyl pyrophosphate synthase